MPGGRASHTARSSVIMLPVIEIVLVCSRICATGSLPAGMAGGDGLAASVPATIETRPGGASTTMRSMRGLLAGAAMAAAIGEATRKTALLLVVAAADSVSVPPA